MSIRRQTEELEQSYLHAKACLSMNSKGRLRPAREGDIRTCFQKDRDRIIHSKAFRRLKHKTQVFLAPKGDHYRTRLTHVLEVSQIARTVARALRLNEDLSEAIALGHDLGHTPFGHAGESVLNEIHPGGFDHYKQSLRVVDFLERNGKGLNLTHEVRDGILKHSKGKGVILPDDADDKAETLEGQIVRICDIIAYVNHDLDDALRAGVIKKSDIPSSIIKVVGDSHSKRIDTMVKDLIDGSIKSDLTKIDMTGNVMSSIDKLRSFLSEKVYESDSIMEEFNKAKEILKNLYSHYMNNFDVLEQHFKTFVNKDIYSDIKKEKDRKQMMVCDFIAGMTDHFAIMTYEKLFLPQQWTVM
ncbi:MAG: deoxyguanosinetriphosphate triphosphohydrolase [Nitrospirota bacterium]|nr:MAG: deoxyguanosinetriphosphate triphosphohydrolase [Nitrospirota bacterium]